MSKNALLKIAGDKPVEFAVLAIAAAAAVYWILNSVKSFAGAAANTAEAAANSVVGAGVGIATGNNVVTNNTPYQGTGIFGTLGAATNDVLGGAPQAFGEWLADKFSSSTDDGTSSSNQGSNNNTFAYGTSPLYAAADDGSAKQATVVASPGATGDWGSSATGSW